MRVNATRKGSPRGELAPVRVTERGSLLKNNYTAPLRLDKLGTSPRGEDLTCLYMKIFLLPDFYMVFRKEQ